MTSSLHLVTSAPAVIPTIFYKDQRAAARAPAGCFDECLGAMAEELGRNLSADGLFIAWLGRDQEPTFLYESGECSEVERTLLSAACDETNRDGAEAVSWSTLDMNAEGAAVVTGRIHAEQGTIAVSGLFHRLTGAKREEVRRSVNQLLPMMRAFFRMWASRARALATNRGMTAALNSSDVATVLIDAEGVPVFANAAAERLIARKDGLLRVGRKLAGRRLADTVRLQAAIEHVVHGMENGQEGTPVVALGRDTGRSLLAAVVSAGVMLREPGQVAAVVHVFDPTQGLEKLVAPVCRLYGLTVVETRLALLLVEGRSLTEAAKLLRIQDQTARSYLKQMFVKMGINRQSELIGLLLRSAVRMDSNLPLSFV